MASAATKRTEVIGDQGFGGYAPQRPRPLTPHLRLVASAARHDNPLADMNRPALIERLSSYGRAFDPMQTDDELRADVEWAAFLEGDDQ